MTRLHWPAIFRSGTAPLRGVRALALLSLFAFPLPGWATAGCTFDPGNAQGTYSISLPQTLVNDPNIAVGSVLYTSTATPISQRVNFSCDNGNNGWGLVNAVGSTPAIDQNLFPTGVTGVGYRVLQKGEYIRPYPYFDLGKNSSWYEADAVTIELVKTAAITDGSVLPAGLLSRFQAGNTSQYIFDAVINLAGSLKFTAPACRVDTSNIDVFLPTVTSQSFTGVDSVAGLTPFQIGLTCSSGATLRITLDTAAAVSGKTGVIAPTSGGASGIGVQLLDSSGVTPVNFGTPAVIGATPDGALSVGYFARYYQTAATAGAGSVSATATFTLSYQ